MNKIIYFAYLASISCTTIKTNRVALKEDFTRIKTYLIELKEIPPNVKLLESPLALPYSNFHDIIIVSSNPVRNLDSLSRVDEIISKELTTGVLEKYQNIKEDLLVFTLPYNNYYIAEFLDSNQENAKTSPKDFSQSKMYLLKKVSKSKYRFIKAIEVAYN